uniref:EF-hand domain-containing protein n=1 Tax=viral metagenome TaxID=1070528 RepID=A0A6C0IFX5_9ZZZZ
MTKDKNIKEHNGSFSFITNSLSYINNHILLLNNNKFFAGIVMIMLNIASKFITVEFSKSAQEYMKYTICKQILVFAMAWMGTRDIYTALGLTAIFTILSEYLFNEESNLCVVPHEHRVLHKLADTNNDGVVSESELNAAIALLEKSKKDKQKKEQKDAYLKFDYKQYN